VSLDYEIAGDAAIGQAAAVRRELAKVLSLIHEINGNPIRPIQ
jgi:hypothetical protein